MLSIRFAQNSHLPAIVDIYNQAIRSRCATGDMDEFTVVVRIDWFNQHSPDSFPVYVVEMNNKVLGFGSLSPYRPGRRAMDKVAEVSFFLDYNHHHKGIGTALLTHMINDCNRLGINSLIAILLNINIPSIALLKKHGFEQWGLMPQIINFEDKTCDHLYYGLTINK